MQIGKIILFSHCWKKMGKINLLFLLRCCFCFLTLYIFNSWIFYYAFCFTTSFDHEIELLCVFLFILLLFFVVYFFVNNLLWRILSGDRTRSCVARIRISVCTWKDERKKREKEKANATSFNEITKLCIFSQDIRI